MNRRKIGARLLRSKKKTHLVNYDQSLLFFCSSTPFALHSVYSVTTKFFFFLGHTELSDYKNTVHYLDDMLRDRAESAETNPNVINLSEKRHISSVSYVGKENHRKEERERERQERAW